MVSFRELDRCEERVWTDLHGTQHCPQVLHREAGGVEETLHLSAVHPEQSQLLPHRPRHPEDGSTWDKSCNTTRCVLSRSQRNNLGKTIFLHNVVF